MSMSLNEKKDQEMFQIQEVSRDTQMNKTSHLGFSFSQKNNAGTN